MKIYEATIKYTCKGESFNPLGEALNDPFWAHEYIKDVFKEDPFSESFWVVFCDRKNNPICRQMISIGGLNSATVDLKKIFKYALLNNASALIAFHNHPSGNTEPSTADLTLTTNLVKAGKFLEIDVLDHIIVSGDSSMNSGKEYLSLHEKYNHLF